MKETMGTRSMLRGSLTIPTHGTQSVESGRRVGRILKMSGYRRPTLGDEERRRGLDTRLREAGTP